MLMCMNHESTAKNARPALVELKNGDSYSGTLASSPETGLRTECVAVHSRLNGILVASLLLVVMPGVASLLLD